MKKYSIALLAVLLCLLLFGCSSAKVYSEITIFNKTGAGTRNITVYIEKDHRLSSDDRRSGNTNSVFFPKGFEPVRDFLQSIVPEWCEIGFEEQTNHWVYTLSYSFKGIDDYNKKTRQLINDIIYDDEELEPATLTAVEKDGGWDVTFKEQTAVLHSIVLGYVTELHFQDEIFDRARNGIGVVAPRDNFELSRISVKIGNNAKRNYNVSNKYIEAADFISYEDEQKFREENPDYEPTPEETDESAFNGNQGQGNNDGAKPEKKNGGIQVQNMLIIAFCLIAVSLTAAYIAKTVFGRKGKQIN